MIYLFRTGSLCRRRQKRTQSTHLVCFSDFWTHSMRCQQSEPISRLVHKWTKLHYLMCSEWECGERGAEAAAAERAVRGDHGAEPRAHRADGRADRAVREAPARAARAHRLLRRRRQHARPALHHPVGRTRSTSRCTRSTRQPSRLLASTFISSPHALLC